MEYAREKHNRSIDRIADLMGLANKWVLYKWLESGRMPAILIRPFEAACGIDLVTRYIGHSANKMLIEIPTGRKVTATDLNELQSSFAGAVSLLVEFYERKNGSDEALAALTGLLEDVAWHRKNVQEHLQPGLELEVTS
ncbi:hypothetical protein [Marinobacter goseongensis]|uniref:hypothetical protein n=1 Tax=Marinobacter goseongensis TaxID=453838 RepID=UPI0020041CC6|nr:hypothetical protein [Marinobacter goseongensis]MCK7553039.1 hypothetical protein [Marinobacter goseongensis]